MIAKELISDLIPPLKTSDTGAKALAWMHEFGVSHLPIVMGEKFMGLISEDDILDLSDSSQAIGNHGLSLFKPFVFENVHLFEVIKIAAELKLTLIPVIDKDETYLGVITQENIIHFFALFSSISDSGGIIVLEIKKTDYVLTEIARIVESNDAYILCSLVTSTDDNAVIEVTLKVNVSDVKHIIATFERFEYTVKASFQEAEFADQLKDRYAGLMNYLNI